MFEEISPRSLFTREHVSNETFDKAEKVMEQIGATDLLMHAAGTLAQGESEDDTTVTVELGAPKRPHEEPKLVIRWGAKGAVRTPAFGTGVVRETSLSSHGLIINGNEDGITRIRIAYHSNSTIRNDWVDLEQTEEYKTFQKLTENDLTFEEKITLGLAIGSSEHNIIRDNRRYTDMGELVGTSISGLPTRVLFPKK